MRLGGVGNEAYTAFLIRRHKIVQWRRVVKPGPEDDADSGTGQRELDGLEEEVLGDLDGLGHAAGGHEAGAPVDVAQPVGAVWRTVKRFVKRPFLLILALPSWWNLPFFLPLAR